MFRRELDLPPLEEIRRPVKQASKQIANRVEKTNRIL
jgi:hypothetical protein